MAGLLRCSARAQIAPPDGSLFISWVLAVNALNRLIGNPRLPLFWSLDFNVNPMCSVIGQCDADHIYVLDELAPPDSNTWAACEAFLDHIGRWGFAFAPYN